MPQLLLQCPSRSTTNAAGEGAQDMGRPDTASLEGPNVNKRENNPKKRNSASLSVYVTIIAEPTGGVGIFRCRIVIPAE